VSKPSLAIYGSDLAILTHLAAALRSCFGSIAVIHTGDAYRRATAAPDGSQEAIVCIDALEDIRATPTRRLVLITPAAADAERLRRRGWSCYTSSEVRLILRHFLPRTPAPTSARRMSPSHRWPARSARPASNRERQASG
jgi:hypothetical protein